MVAVDEARRLIAANIELRAAVKVQLSQAAGFILAKDIKSEYDVPSFDNSAMDGYAFRYSANVNDLDVIDCIEAGRADLPPLGEGQAMRIFTGAPIPPGADTVVQQELVALNGHRISFDGKLLRRGVNVRKTGAQSRSGECIAKKGNLITPGLTALLASVGIEDVSVYSLPSVAVITTGNEVQETGVPLKPFRIYNSNAPALGTYLKTLGISDTGFFHAEDRPDMIRDIIRHALEKYDIVVLTGGVSVGDYDFVRDALLSLNVHELFYKVKQKPGKPLFAGIRNSKWIFALPGNPAAVLTCFNQYVKPCIRSLIGFSEQWLPSRVLPLNENYIKKGSLTHFVKAKISGGRIEILPGQESFNLLSFAEADGFAELPEDTEEFGKGSLLKFYSW